MNTLSWYLSRMARALCIALLLTGCTGLGAPTVTRDRFDYVSAISESWKRQTLLNLVKTRYADAPVFMDVTSVINQYSVEGRISLGATWTDSPGTDSQTLGGSATYADRPTITYNPVMGERFTRNFMTPIPVPGILSLLQIGYPADKVFRLCVHTINGIENSFGSPFESHSADPRFLDLTTAIHNIQKAGGLGMRVNVVDDKQAFVIFFRRMIDSQVTGDLDRVREILGINPNASELEVVFGSHAENDHQIAILTRSMMQISNDLASAIEVPEDDVIEGRVYEPRIDNTLDEATIQMLRIRYTAKDPKDAYAAVPYRGGWFWIDDRDYMSKRTFYSYMLLSSLTEIGQQTATPIVTVPTN